MFYSAQLDTLPVSNSEIRRDNMSDPALSYVLKMVSTGHFPAAKDSCDELLPYLLRRNNLTIQQGCLMWGVRVVMPPKLCPRVLKELHTAHPGVVRMKCLARSYVWWPGIDSQIELEAKSYTLACGPTVLGRGYMWTLQVHLKDICTWSLWTHIPVA